MDICVSGGKGRFGQAICTLASSDPDVSSVTVLSREDDTGTNIMEAMSGSDVLIICCNNPKAAADQAIYASELDIDVVLGTTGFKDDHMTMLQSAAARVNVACSSNFDTTAQQFILQAYQMALNLKSQGLSFSTEVREVHREGKVDSPSGTAWQLAKAVQLALGMSTPLFVDNQKRIKPGEIVIRYSRFRTVDASHKVTFIIEGGRKMIQEHLSGEPVVYAEGALTAAKELVASEIPYGFHDLNALSSLDHSRIT